jgi:hypothetical protein
LTGKFSIASIRPSGHVISRRSTVVAVAIAAFVQQQLHWSAVAGDEQIEIAIVVDVALRQRTAHRLGGERRPRLSADITKSIARVAQQQTRLRVLRAFPELGDVVDDVAVDDCEITSAVVVIVQERDSETNVGKWQRTQSASDA